METEKTEKTEKEVKALADQVSRQIEGRSGRYDHHSNEFEYTRSPPLPASPRFAIRHETPDY